jgi:hypothetical protein
MRLFTLNQDIEMNLDSSSSLKQQSIGTHSTPTEYPELYATCLCSFYSMLIALGRNSKCHMKAFDLTILYIEPASISTRCDVIERKTIDAF